MSKLKKLKKKLNAFVDQLTPDEVREQLILAYLQMERCQQVLRGEDIEPVAMKDNGLSSDLELFYLCKKKAEELKLAETDWSKLCVSKEDADKHTIKIKIDVDTLESESNLEKIRNTFEKFKKDGYVDKLTKMCEELRGDQPVWKNVRPLIDKYENAWHKSMSDSIEHVSEEAAKSINDILKNVTTELEKSETYANELFKEKPSKQAIDAIRKYARSYKSLPCAGDEVWYWHDKLTCSRIVSAEYNSRDGWKIELADGSILNGYDGLYRTKEELISRLKEYVCDEERPEPCKENKLQSKFKVGDEVYYIWKNQFHKGEIEKVLEDNAPYDFHLSNGMYLKEGDAFATLDELLNHLKENVNGEEK